MRNSFPKFTQTPMKELYTVIQQVNDLQKAGLKFVLATVVRVEGSAYRRPGARMLIAEDGNWWGGISGGCLEGDILKKAQLALFSQSYKTITYDTREEDPFALGIGLGCQGVIEIHINPFQEQIKALIDALKSHLEGNEAHTLRMQLSAHFQIELEAASASHGSEWSDNVFTEYLPAPMTVWVFGNQFDAQGFIQQANGLAWRVNWVGILTKMNSNLMVMGRYGYEDIWPIQSSDFLVMMTHDLEKDMKILEKLISAPVKPVYVGILGPKKRFEKLQNHFKQDLVTLLPISTPIGLDIGAEGPEEIAISIISEILSIKNNRNGQRLILRDRAIHE
jgi:xanthine/CO dehydrogenase XdhC/CoxF family maturation factor